ncbi:hypothetical protein Ciccas_008026 [Cichlidogyrus casuarinus]|uniref:J domain-containing protein n=1 Tax=Cichlidogyrus casuarinus TaxID=1844966 RepID=A0ABD2Q2D2_9PLAT
MQTHSRRKLNFLQDDLEGANPYELLGVATTASQTEIRTAYFEKAKQTHPDTNTENKTADQGVKFRQIASAYAILSNPVSRRSVNESLGIFTKDARTADEGATLYWKPHTIASMTFEKAREIHSRRKMNSVHLEPIWYQRSLRKKHQSKQEYFHSEDMWLRRKQPPSMPSCEPPRTYTDRLRNLAFFSQHADNSQFHQLLNIFCSTLLATIVVVAVLERVRRQ